MAWIESHQELGQHPKLKRLAHRLGISRVQAVGHLHYLWWWAMEYAQDGDLGAGEAWEVADHALWDGDPDQFLDALRASGFVDPDGKLHDWYEYAGKMIERRKADAERKRAGRSKDGESPSGGRPPDVRDISEGRRAESGVTVTPTVTPTTTKPPEKNDDARPRARSAAPADAAVPFALVEAMCAAQGEDVSVLSRRDVEKQCAAGKRLAEGGATPDDVRRMVGWLRSQSWVEGGVDLILVEKQIGKWRLAGKPDAATPRGSPNGRQTAADRLDADAAEFRRLLAAEQSGHENVIEARGSVR